MLCNVYYDYYAMLDMLCFCNVYSICYAMLERIVNTVQYCFCLLGFISGVQTDLSLNSNLFTSWQLVSHLTPSTLTTRLLVRLDISSIGSRCDVCYCVLDVHSFDRCRNVPYQGVDWFSYFSRIWFLYIELAPQSKWHRPG